MYYFFHGLPWYAMVSHGLPWSAMVSHGLPWPPMDSHGTGGSRESPVPDCVSEQHTSIQAYKHTYALLQLRYLGT